MSEKTTVFITDSLNSSLPPQIPETAYIVLWNSFSVPELTDPTVILSLPQYIETNSERLKNNFLSFVDQVGLAKFDTKSVIDHLTLSDGFSYWWMTLFACKRWTESSKIVEAIKLLALEEILVVKSAQVIEISLCDHTVKKIIKKWCADNFVEWKDTSKNRRGSSKQDSKFHLMPRPSRAAFVLLREILTRRNVRATNYNSISPVDTVLIDHFSRFDKAEAEHGRFVSGFWGRLLDTNQITNHRVSFIHNYVESANTPNINSANQLVDKLNVKPIQDFHILVNSRMQLKSTLLVIGSYSRLVIVRFRIRDIKHHFKPNNSRLDLWPLFRTEWFDSLSGSTAMMHAVIISDFKLIARTVSPCKQFVYLMENQPWEMALLQIFKKQRPEPLIGYPHSTIRYWDLRYWRASNKVTTIDSVTPPVSDIVVSNGSSTRVALESSGFNFRRIEDIEALSYLYLGDIPETKKSELTPRLLILGDFFSAQNLALLTLLNDVESDARSKFKTTFKPHPLCTIDRHWASRLNLVVDLRPLSELLQETDIVISTNGTSAAAEAYQFGVKVISVLNGDTPNFSPIRGLPGAIFVASALELQQELESGISSHTGTRNKYFSVDSSLKGWRKVLAVN